MKKYYVLILMLVSLGMAGCTGAYKDNKVPAISLHSGAKVEITVKDAQINPGMLNSLGCVQFTTKIDIADIVQQIAKDYPEGSVELLDRGNALIYMQNDIGCTDIFYLEQHDTGNKRMGGRLSGMSRDFIYNLPDERFTILFPYHLIDDERMEAPNPVYIELPYLVYPEITIDDIYQFYASTGYYNIETEAGGIILTGYTNKVLNLYDSLPLPGQIKISIRNHLGVKYICLSVLEALR